MSPEPSTMSHQPSAISHIEGRALPLRGDELATVGESFSEIFQGNAAMLGLPCFVASHEAVERLQTLIETTPDVAIAADVASGAITAGTMRIAATLPPALRDGFVSGQWNPTLMLLDRYDEVRAVADRLPYMNWVIG